MLLNISIDIKNIVGKAKVFKGKNWERENLLTRKEISIFEDGVSFFPQTIYF